MKYPGSVRQGPLTQLTLLSAYKLVCPRSLATKTRILLALSHTKKQVLHAKPTSHLIPENSPSP